MGVYIKNGSGDIKKLAGYVTVRQNARWFLCTRTIEDNVEYYTVPKEAETYFKSINAYTIYSFGFNESNTTNTPKLRYGTTVLDIKDFSNQAGEVMVGQLNGVFQMFTQDLATDPKIYFVANTHKDEYDTEMSNTSINAVQNKVIKAYVDNIETLAEAIRDNTTQIAKGGTAFEAGGATSKTSFDPSYDFYVAIGKNANAQYGGIAIGLNSTVGAGGSSDAPIAIGRSSEAKGSNNIAIGQNAKLPAVDNRYVNNRIQLGTGSNSTANSLQIFKDNIYNHSTHTATFQNLQIGGVDEYPTLSGADAPTTTTVGKVKQFYVETTTPALYYCSSITGTGTTEDPYVYNWTQAGGDETLAKQIQNNEVQIKTSNNGFRAGGAQINDGYGVAIGNNSYAGSDSCVALGTGANAAFIDCYQIGSGWNTVSGTLQIKDDTIYDVNSHTAMFENIKQDGNPIYGILQGEADPTTETVGAVSQFYLNTTDKKLWQCVAVTTDENTSTTSYEWQPVGAGVSQEDFDKLVNNETQIVAQSNLSFSAGGAIGNNFHGVAIGLNSKAEYSQSVCIGKDAESYRSAGVAIGHSAKVYGNNTIPSIAIGSSAQVHSDKSIQLGTGMNNTANSLQIYDDNIYKTDTHTLTVQNIELNGVDLGTLLGDINTALETILGV